MESERIWTPLSLPRLRNLFASAEFPWWVAGGYAIELAVGRSFREHEDIDVLILRRDQTAVRRWLAKWECWAADPPGHLRPWQMKEVLPLGAHDVWCREGGFRESEIVRDEQRGRFSRTAARSTARTMPPCQTIA